MVEDGVVQMGYADDKAIPYVAIVGSNEMDTNTVMLKNMTTGEQKQVTLDELCTIQANNLTK